MRRARWAAVALLLAAVILGGLAYAHQLVAGDVVTSMRTLGAGGAVWGLYVVMDGFLLSVGVALMTCACLARFSRDFDLEVAARIAMPMALACFLAAALCVLADQGRPFEALWNLSRVARPQSPVFATFTTVGGICLLPVLVHWLLARRPDLAEYAKQPSPWRWLRRLLAAGYRGSEEESHRRRQVGFWMSLALLPALAVPLFALTVIFTVRPGRPLPLVVGEAVTFAISAGAAGLGVLVLAAALVGRPAGPGSGLGRRGFARLGRGLLLADALSALGVVMVEIAGLRSDEPAAVGYANALLGDAYGSLFWAEVGLFLFAGFVLWRGAWRTGLRERGVVFAGLLSVVAVFLQRYIVLVAWQTHGLSLPYQPGSYAPSFVEVAVVLGILALSLLVLLILVRVVPFAAATAQPRVASGSGRRGRWRGWITAGWLGAGGSLASLGLLLSWRVGTEPFLDPELVGSPLLFVAGLVMLATAGAVYELLPDRPN